MSHSTGAEFNRARQLVVARRQLINRVAALRSELARARAVAETHNDARNERLNFSWKPQNLSGLIELKRRTDQLTARQIPWRYTSFLASIHDGPALGGPPLKVDFNALPSDARPYLLAPFLKLSIGGVFPRLDLDRSDIPRGKLVYIVTGGPANPADWLPHLEHISAWLGAHWALTAHTSTTVTLTRHTPLPSTLPFNNHYLKRGALFVGIDTTTRQPQYIPFADMTSGTFVPGASGFGKSNALHILLKSIFTNLDLFTAVYLCDGKDGVAFDRYRGTHNKVHVLWEEKDVWDLTTKLVAIMRERNTAQRAAGTDKSTKDFIAVVIDEMSTYAAKPSSDSKNPDNKRHGQFIDELAMLAKRGRSTGLRLLITAQEPVVTDVPANVRANCTTVLSFQLPLDAHATAVFGQLEGLPVDPRKIPRGRALMKNGMTGALQVVQFPLTPVPTPKSDS